MATARETWEQCQHGLGCLGKAYHNDDGNEPVFVLRAQDRTASYAVRAWAVQALLAADIARECGRLDICNSLVAKSMDAMKCANEMDAWGRAHKTKLPD